MSVILGLVGLIVVFTIMIIVLKRERKSQDKIHIENLDDEYLYDPETGKKYRLEEVDTIDFGNPNPNRIKTEAEIQTYFNEEEIDVERILIW